MNIYKAIQINGIVISEEIGFSVIYKNIECVFRFVPYAVFRESSLKFINSDVIGECDTVVIYSSMANNSQEVYYIKICLAIIYFANRIVGEREPEKALGRTIEKPFVSDCNLNGYWDKEGSINDNSWYIKLGQKGITYDDFESYITRAYGDDLDDSYDKRYVFSRQSTYVDVDICLKETLTKLNRMILEDNDMCRRIKSVARLYYEVLSPHCNVNVSIIVLATILETLLLGEDENNQRKKVSVRTACIIYDGYDLEWKSYIADMVYYFYRFRNGIVHDGMNYLDYPEITINNLIYNTKHFIFYLIKKVYQGAITSQEDIIDIVNKNKKQDGIENAFDYISGNAGSLLRIMPPE